MNNLVVKMMSGEDIPDCNNAKGFTLVEAYGEVRCKRDDKLKPIIEIPMEDGDVVEYRPEGNTYVLKNGKTIATFSHQGHAPYVEAIRELAGEYNRYATDTNVIVNLEQFKNLEVKGPHFLILKDLMPGISQRELAHKGLRHLGDVINIDASAVFGVFDNLNEQPTRV